jgi:hypothetical protein
MSNQTNYRCETCGWDKTYYNSNLEVFYNISKRCKKCNEVYKHMCIIDSDFKVQKINFEQITSMHWVQNGLVWGKTQLYWEYLEKNFPKILN